MYEETTESSTDPDSRLFRKGKTASGLRFMSHALPKSRNGLTVNARSRKPLPRRARSGQSHGGRCSPSHPGGEIKLAADSVHGTAEFEALQGMEVTPHVAQNKSNRKSAVTEEIASILGMALVIDAGGDSSVEKQAFASAMGCVRVFVQPVK